MNYENETILSPLRYKDEIRGMIIAIAFIGLVVVLVLLVEPVRDKLTEVTAIVAIGFAFYFAASGKLEELAVPGIKLKLREFVQKNIQPKFEQITDRIITAQEGEEIEKGAVSELERIIPDILQKRYTTLTIRRNGPRIVDRALSRWLNILLKYDFFKHVIFVDDKGKFIGHIFAIDMHYLLLRDLQYGGTIQTIINRWQEELTQIPEIPGLVTDYIRAGSTYGSALRKIVKLKRDYVPIIDNSGKFSGTITHEEITDELLKIFPQLSLN
jgi:hypothetical protein